MTFWTNGHFYSLSTHGRLTTVVNKLMYFSMASCELVSELAAHPLQLLNGVYYCQGVKVPHLPPRPSPSVLVSGQKVRCP